MPETFLKTCNLKCILWEFHTCVWCILSSSPILPSPLPDHLPPNQLYHPCHYLLLFFTHWIQLVLPLCQWYGPLTGATPLAVPLPSPETLGLVSSSPSMLECGVTWSCIDIVLLISELGIVCMRIQKYQKINCIYYPKGYLFLSTNFKCLSQLCLPHKTLQGIF